jgi:tetratricopeptide (TPR) repeat protein
MGCFVRSCYSSSSQLPRPYHVGISVRCAIGRSHPGGIVAGWGMRSAALFCCALFLTVQAAYPAEHTDPVAWLQAVPRPSVVAASFLQVTPGKTTRQEIANQFHVSLPPNDPMWTVPAAPFRRVDVHFSQDVVARVRVEFASPKLLHEVISELRLDRFTTVVGSNPSDATTVLLVPERGLQLVMAREDAEQQVVAIELYVPAADDFVLRAYRLEGLALEARLADLEQALELDKHHVVALVALAGLWEQIGYGREAAARLQAASGDVDQPALRVERARLAALAGQPAEAAKLLETLSSDTHPDGPLAAKLALVRALIKSEAGAGNTTNEAIEHYRQAIELAQKALPTAGLIELYQLRDILVDAYLGGAWVIARSSLHNRHDSAARWLEQADYIVRQTEQRGDSWFTGRSKVWLCQLACFRRFQGSFPWSVAAESVQSWGERLLAAASDPYSQRYAATTYGHLLLLMSYERLLRGSAEDAQRLAEQAARLLADTAQRQPPHAVSEGLLGQAYYLLGAICAMARRDHAAAVRWYDRAIPLLDRQWPVWLEPQQQGDQWVSIGLSYWQMGDQQAGLDYTERGWTRIEAAIRNGLCDAQARQAVCNNLAVMYQALGRTDKAQSMAELARSSEKSTSDRPAISPR